MRACMVAYTFYETDNRVRRYAETLVKQGHTVDAIVLKRPGQTSFDVICGVNVYRIQKRVTDEKHPLSYLFRLLAFFVRSSYLLTVRHLRQPYRIIHVHSVPDFQVFSALIPCLLGAKVILDIHDIVPELYASKFRIGTGSFVFSALVRMERASVRFSDHVIIANHLWYDRLLSRSAESHRCTTILNYPDLSIFRAFRHDGTRDSQEFLMCYPGTLSWHQGVDLIIAAMAKIRDKAPQAKLLIFGDGPERHNLQAMVKQLRLEDRVTIGDPLSIEGVAATMATVDLGVEPKRKQSFGNEALSTKILEFMAMDVPVLASDTRINQLYFSGGLVAFFDSEEVEDLAGAILRLINDRDERQRLRAAGLDYVRKNNWDVKMHEYLDIVDRLTQPQATIRAAPIL